MKIASAQIRPVAQNTEANISNHLRVIEEAAEQGVSFILFPEMSLTGYELELAAELAFEVTDQRLDIFAEKAKTYNMVIAAGAPVRIDGELYIGSFIFLPDGTMKVYTKQYLHVGEERFFVSGLDRHVEVEWNNEKIAFAICADIVNPLHAEAASKTGTTLYAASIFYSTPTGIVEAYEQLSRYAREYGMQVLMANFTGVSYNLEARGISAFWNKEGKLVKQLNEKEEGLLVVSTGGSEY